MRPIERIVVIGGIVLALALSLGGRVGSEARAGVPRADAFRLGTVDLYYLIERLMKRPDLDRARKDLDAAWRIKIESLERDLGELEGTLRVLPQDSPNFRETADRYQAKQKDYQKLGQDRNQELEKLNTGQLLDSYKQVRQATTAVAERAGYTHVMASRSFERPLETTTLNATLQEFLARPLIKGVPADDLTEQVSAELKLGDQPPPQP